MSFFPCLKIRPPAGLPRLGTVLTLSAAGLMAACASLTPQDDTHTETTTTTPVASSAAATLQVVPAIAVPPTSVGQWIDLGLHRSAWLSGDAPVPVNAANAATRVAGLQAEDGRWLALVLVQQTPAASAPCPSATRLHVRDSGAGCLRLRRNADFDLWLERQHPVLHDWIDSQGWATHPRAWISHRMPAGDGGTLEAHALLHPSLIEPTTRDNSDFLAGGQPGLRWARQFAQATRSASSAGTARLQVPPFPFVAPADPQLLAGLEAARKAEAESAPGVATQVRPADTASRPPAARARQDRH